MNKNNKFRFGALTIAIFTVLYGCGGGDSSDSSTPTTPTTTLAGKVNIPASVLDPQQTGTAPLPNATVEVVELDNKGVETGTIVATTTTNSAGEYSYTNTGIKASSRQRIKVRKDTVTMRAPLYSTEVNVDPVSEAVVTKVQDDVATGKASDIDNFTPSELSALVSIAASKTADYSSALSLTEAVNTITTTSGLDTLTADLQMTDPGDTTSTSGLGGDYNHVFSVGSFDIISITATSTSVAVNNWAGANNSVSLNGGLMSSSLTVDEHKLVVTKTASGPSVSTLSQTLPTEYATDPYYVSANHQLYVGDLQGGASPTGNQFVVAERQAFTNYGGRGIHFAGKKLTAAPSLSGKAFHLVGLQHWMGTTSTTSADFDVETYNGSVSFTGSNTATMTVAGDIVRKDLIDNITIVSDPFTDTGLTYTVGSTGTVSISSPTIGTNTIKGFVSGNTGSYIGGLIADDATHQGHGAFVMIEAATAANAALLNGNYNVVEICTAVDDPDPVNPYNANTTLQTNIGVATLDGAGIGAINFTNNYSTFNAGGVAGSMSITSTTGTAPSQPFTYTVGADGKLDFVVTGVNAVVSGAVSADGNLIATTSSYMGSRCLSIGTKQ